jgi:hypothetical protein
MAFIENLKWNRTLDFIRLGIIFALIVACGIFLKKNYGYDDRSLVLALRLFVGLGVGVFFFEILMARFLKKYLISMIFGVILGSVISVPCIDWIKNLSFLSPVLQDLPWQPVLRLAFIYLVVLFVCYWSQDQFCRNKIDLNLRSKNSKEFQIFRWIFRVVVGGVFLLMLLISLNSSSEGGRNALVLDMVNRGYDFTLELERTVSSPSLIMWILFGVFFAMECVFGNIYLRWVWFLMPAVGFTVMVSGLGIEILGMSLARWVPSDLFQLFFVVLCGYLGFSWSLRSLMKGNYRLPFLKINFESFKK